MKAKLQLVKAIFKLVKIFPMFYVDVAGFILLLNFVLNNSFTKRLSSYVNKTFTIYMFILAGISILIIAIINAIIKLYDKGSNNEGIRNK